MSNARALLVLVPGALLAFGVVVDVLQGWFVRPAASERDRLRAELLHPYDARVVLPRAVRALAHGDGDEARALLGEAAIARAFSPEAARARFLACVLGDASGAAARRCIEVPAYLADDVDVLAMSARIALGSGRPDIARQKARRAVELAPDDPVTLGSLGMVEAKLQEPLAKDHLARAIELQQRRIGADPLTGDPSFFDVGVALAEAWRARKEPDAALAVLDRVVEGATAAGRPQAALRALALRGRILDDGGDARAALDAYQRALRVAPFAKLPVEEAALWLDFGGLLGRSDAPAARYASTLKAAAAVASLPEDHHDKARLGLVTTTLRAELERALPADVQERVRADVDGEALKALSLSYD